MLVRTPRPHRIVGIARAQLLDESLSTLTDPRWRDLALVQDHAGRGDSNRRTQSDQFGGPPVDPTEVLRDVDDAPPRARRHVGRGVGSLEGRGEPVDLARQCLAARQVFHTPPLGPIRPRRGLAPTYAEEGIGRPLKLLVDTYVSLYLQYIRG